MLRDLFEGRSAGDESRAISFQSIWGAGDSLAWQTDSGANVTPDSSFGVSAFYAAVNLISGSISTLPVDAFYKQNGERKPFRPKPEWVNKPDVDLISGQAHWQQVLISLLVWGNSYTRVFRDKQGNIVNLVALDPTLVNVTRNAIGRKIFTYIGEENKSLTTDDVLHITDMLLPGAVKGKGRVEALKENIGLGIALQAFAARFFGGGSQVAGIIEFPGTLAKEQAKALADGFDSRHGGYRKAHRTGVLSGGAKYTKVGSTPEESQMLESRNMAVVDIARMFQIPPHLLGVPGYNSHASVEQMTQDFVTYTLRPFVEKIEVGYSTLLPGGGYLKWNLDGLIRADFQTRMQAYSTANQTGWLSLNDIRRLEDFAPIDGGDVYRVPLANVNLNAADLSAQEGKVTMAQKLIQVGFDPASVLASLGLPPMVHTGVPSAQLQQVSTIDPNDPAKVYQG